MSIRLSPAVDVERCNGCKTCEVVCSLHLKGSFGVSDSGIRIIRLNIHGPILFEVNEDCDLCNEIKIPLCVQFCTSDAIKMIEDPSGRSFLK